MPVRAFGRIVVWEGGSLWIFGTRPGEVYPRTTPHSHHAVQLTLALRGTVNLFTDGDSYAGAAAAVAPDVSHTFQTDGAVAHLFVEPESRIGRALGARVFDRTPLAALDTASIDDCIAQ